MSALRHVGRGLLARCPCCGRGKLFDGFLKLRPRCGACGAPFQRDPGDWSGGAEITVVLAIFLATIALFVLMATTTWNPLQELVAVMGGTIVVVPFVYRVVKGGWIGVLRAWEGPDPQPSPIREPEWFSRFWDSER